MKDFESIILRKFPNDNRLDCWVKPHMPSNVVGKALGHFTAINSPTDVIAFHSFGNMFTGGSIVITKSFCYYEKNMFPLEELKTASVQGKIVVVGVNQGGKLLQHNLKTGSEQVAKFFVDFFDAVISDVHKTEVETTEKPDYSKFNGSSLDWLELRDEVMRTIDLLYQKYEDGKLTMLEFEAKKADLLARL